MGTQEQGWDQLQWLLAYAHALQHVGEAVDGRTWRPNGKQFTPQISQLVDAFIAETQVELVEAEVALCWNEPWEVLCQMDEGAFAEVISCLDQLAKGLPTRQTWDELVFPPPQPNLAHLAGVDTWGILWATWWTLGRCCPPCNSMSVNRMGSSSAWHEACCLRGVCWLMTLPLMRLSGPLCRGWPVICHWQRRPPHVN